MYLSAMATLRSPSLSLALAALLTTACTRPAASGARTTGAGSGGSAGGNAGTSGSGGQAEAPPSPPSPPDTVITTPAGPGAFTVEGAHYQLYAEAPQAQAAEMGRLLEAAYPAFGAWFQAAPSLAAGERLQVRYYADAGNWEAGLAADGIAAPTEAGGYYAPSTRTAYLFQQGNPYYSHVLLVHEATHQYHHLARTHGRELPFWYVEGHAEYLSRHDWDGRSLRLGVTPMLSWEDIAAPALAAPALDVAALVSGAAPPDRAAAWALFRHLDQGPRHDAFQRFRAAVDAGEADPARSFSILVGDPAALAASLAAWLPGAQEPMKPIFTEWTHVGPGAVTADSRSYFSLAIVKDPVSHFEARWDVARMTGGSAGAVGVVVAYQDERDYEAVVASPGGALRTFTAIAGSVQWGDAGTAPPPAGGVGTVAVDFGAGGAVTVTVNGAATACSIGTLPPGAGLAVSDARVAWYGVRWR